MQAVGSDQESLTFRVERNHTMAIELPPLPFAEDALAAKGLSKETIEYHYGKHHQTYVNVLNGLIEGTDHADASLEEIRACLLNLRD